MSDQSDIQSLDSSVHRRRVEDFQNRHRVGLLTLVFTDMVGSTRLKQDLGDLVAVDLIYRHHALVRELVAGFAEAEEIGTSGDSFFILFTKPSDAVRFSLLLQSALRTFNKSASTPVMDRIGIHIGEVVIQEKGGQIHDLYGIQVDTAARVMSLAESGQILLTRSAFDNARQILKGLDISGISPLSWLNFGPFVLKGVEEPIEICEVGEEGLAPLTPPHDSEKVHRLVSAEAEPVLGWRPAIEQHVPDSRWILERKLGEGGFGEVWLARHETLGDRRVFKFCFRVDRVRSLKRELTLFKLLKERVGHHPNIVGVQDVFLDKPPFYLVMDYADALDLPAWIQSKGGPGQSPLDARLEIVAQIADALHAAHSSSILHRDVKPSNILVGRDPSGRILARLTDFGIGKILSEEAVSAITRLGFTETMVGSSSGSQSGSQLYMAPELLSGKPASTRSDIYSLGVVLFQLLVGDFSRPVTTDWADEIKDLLLRDDLRQCFAGNPDLRFGSAGELARQLRALPLRHAEDERNIAAASARERAAYRRGIMRAATLSGAIVILVAGLALFAWQQSHEAKKLAADNARVAIENLRIAAQSKGHLSDQYVNKAAELADQGDYSGALLWNVEALKLAEKNSSIEFAQRVRIGVLLREMPLLQKMLFPGGPVNGLRFVSKETLAVGVDEEGSMILNSWNWKTGDLQPSLGIVSNIWKLESYAGQLSGLGQKKEDDTEGIINLRTGDLLSPPIGNLGARPDAISWVSANGRSLAIGFSFYTFDLWDLTAKKSIYSASMSLPITAAALSAETDKFALGFRSGAVGIYSVTRPDGNPIEFNLGSEPARLEFSRSGFRLLTLTRNGGIQVHELDGLTGPRMLLDGAITIRFSGNDDEVAAGSDVGFAAVWNRVTGDRVTPLLRHRGPVRALDFDQGGCILATGSDEGIVRIWNLGESRKTRLRLKTNDEARKNGYKLESSADTEDLASDSWRKGKTVDLRAIDLHHAQVFDSVVTNRALSTRVNLSGKIVQLTMSSDDAWIAMAGNNRTVRVWDWRKAQPLTPELKLSEEIIGLEFAADKSALFVHVQDGGGEVISLQPASESIESLAARAELYVGDMVNTNVGLTDLSLDEIKTRWETATPRTSVDESLVSFMEWQRQEVLGFETNQMHAQALPHLHSLRLALPENGDIALRRAWSLAELDRLPEAEKEFLSLPALGSRPGEALPLAALVSLRQGRTESFNEIISRLLVEIRAGRLNDSETALAVWTACLATRDQIKIRDWRSVALSVAGRLPDDPRVASTLAFAELRAGEFQTAFDRLENCVKKVSGFERVQLVWIQAMALLKLGKTTPAEDKVDYIRAHRPSRASWDYNAELQIMFDEMRELNPELQPF